MRGQCLDLVAGMLDGAGFVHVDVAGMGAHDALPRAKKRADHGDVSLRSANQEVHACAGALGLVEVLQDLARGGFAPRVKAVAFEGLVIGGG